MKPVTTSYWGCRQVSGPKTTNEGKVRHVDKTISRPQVIKKLTKEDIQKKNLLLTAAIRRLDKNISCWKLKQNYQIIVTLVSNIKQLIDTITHP